MSFQVRWFLCSVCTFSGKYFNFEFHSIMHVEACINKPLLVGILSLTAACLLIQGTGSLLSYIFHKDQHEGLKPWQRRFSFLLSHYLCWVKEKEEASSWKGENWFCCAQTCLPAFIRWGLSYPSLYILPLLFRLTPGAWKGNANHKLLTSQSCSFSHYLTQCLMLEPCLALCPLLHHLVQPNRAGLQFWTSQTMSGCWTTDVERAIHTCP